MSVLTGPRCGENTLGEDVTGGRTSVLGEIGYPVVVYVTFVAEPFANVYTERDPSDVGYLLGSDRTTSTCRVGCRRWGPVRSG